MGFETSREFKKLEQAKVILEECRKDNPQYFEDHHRQNGEQTALAERLLEEYKDLIK